MGDIVSFRGRPPAPETTDDYRDEVTALRAEALDLADKVRPIVARLVMLGVNHTDVPRESVLRQARDLAGIVDFVQQRYGQDGAA